MDGASKPTQGIAKPGPVEKENDYHVYPQLFAGFMANFALLSAGMAIAWPSLALSKLMDENSEVRLTSGQAAWVVAGLQSGACVGPILSAVFVDRIGRKWFLYSCGLPCLISWMLIYFVESFEWLFLARFISGIGVGGSFAAVPMYIGEIAEVRVRGALGAMLSLMLNFGSLLAYITGLLVQSKALALINMIPIGIFLVVFCWMPESPYYYLKKDERERAEKSLVSLRKCKLVERELSEMTDLIKKESEHRGRMTELITVPANRKATLIVWLLVTAQQCSGLIGISSYAVIIFNNTATITSPEIQVLLTGAVGFASSIVATCVIDKLGKKPLFIISCCGVALCLLVIGGCFLFQAELKAAVQLHWVPLAAMLFFYIFFSFGLGPIPYAVLAEVYPTSIKAVATMVASIYGSLVGVITSKLLQVVADAFGYHTIFFAFCIIELIVMCITLFVMPETTGRTFKEIQETLGANNNSKSRDNRV